MDPQDQQISMLTSELAQLKQTVEHLALELAHHQHRNYDKSLKVSFKDLRDFPTASFKGASNYYVKVDSTGQVLILSAT